MRCGHELGIGRFCLNCGHPVGQPLPAEQHRTDPDEDAVLFEAPPRRVTPELSRWLPWVVGGLLILVLLAVLASCLGGDDEESPDTSPAGSKTSESPATPKKAVDLTRGVRVSAPPAAPPTTDLDGQLVSYGTRHMLDSVPSTAWRTAGDATGQVLSFTLARASIVRRVGLINGYARQVPSGSTLVDWYPNNRRIMEVEWVFDDGTVVRQDLREKPALQRLTIEPETTTKVQLRLLGVTPPGASVLGRDYTAISEILISGTPAA